MPVWKPEQVDAVDLDRWAIVETDTGTHVAGSSVQDGGASRISSPIQELREGDRYLETRSRSGRLYRLHGAGGPNSDTIYLINRAKTIWKCEQEMKFLTESEIRGKIVV